MKRAGDDIDAFLENKKNPTSERAYLIQQVCDTIFPGKKPDQFRKILGQTSSFTVGEIRDIFDRARSWQTNPAALFWKLVREKQKEIRERLEEESRKRGV